MNRDSHNPLSAVLASNAVWSLARYAVNWAVLLVVPPFLIHHITTSAYSTWMLLLQFATYYSMLDTSLQVGVSRFVARSAAQSNRAVLGITVSSIAASLSVLGGVILILGFIAALFLDRIFPAIPGILISNARMSAFILITSFGLVLPFSTLAGAFLGFQRNKIVTLAIVISRIGSGCAMIVTAYEGGSILSLACCYAGATLLAPVIYTIAWIRSAESVPIRLFAIRRVTIREFASYSGSLGLIALSSILVTGMSLPIVGIYAFNDITRYSLAMVYGNMLLIPQSAILMTVLPSLSVRSLDGDAAAMGRVLIKLARISAIPLTVFTAGLLAAAPLFLRLWVGPVLAAQVVQPAALLVLASFVGLTAHPYRLATLGAGQQSATVPATLLEGAISVGLSVLLVRPLGATGVATAVLVAAVFGLMAQMIVSVPLTPAIHVPRRTYLAAALFKPALAVVPAGLMFALLWRQSISPLAWLPAIAAATGASAAVAAAIGLDTAERKMGISMLVGKIGRLRVG